MRVMSPDEEDCNHTGVAALRIACAGGATSSDDEYNDVGEEVSLLHVRRTFQPMHGVVLAGCVVGTTCGANAPDTPTDADDEDASRPADNIGGAAGVLAHEFCLYARVFDLL